MILRLLAFVLRSLRASFRGQRMTHILTITTVCVSLALVGAVYVAQQNLVTWAGQWADNLAVAIFLEPDMPRQQRLKLEAELAGGLHLEEIRWTDPKRSARELSRVLGIDGGQTLGEFAPWIIEARRTEQTPEDGLATLSERSGVLFVDQGTVMAERIRTLARSLRLGGTGLSLFLLLGAFLVVSNTVGLALNARRDEVEIMDLVGTPLGWIYAAYISEGVVLGTVGAAVAAILINVPLAIGLADWLRAFGLPPVAGLTGSSAVALLIIGATIGAVASAISVRRFLASRWEYS